MEKTATIIFVLLSLLLTIFAVTLFASSASAQRDIPFPIQKPYSDDFTAKLAQCESGGRSEITILDVNSQLSFGLYQYQLPTFLRYGKQYNILPFNISTSDALLLIHSPTIQTAITKDMLADGLQGAWRNCVAKINKM